MNNKLIMLILAVGLVILGILMTMSPVFAQDYPLPPKSPEETWQPPLGGGEVMNPPAGVESAPGAYPSLQILPPPTLNPGVPGSLMSAYLVNSRGQVMTNLYRNEAIYLVASFSGPGSFYLWEYYPSGYPSYGHWLCYRWYVGHAGIWKIGPFTAEPTDVSGTYTWRMWFNSGYSWSTRTLSFYFNRSYYPPDIPGMAPGPVYYDPSISSFSANKTSIESGETVILTWSTANANTVTISPGIGNVASSGSTSVTPPSSTTYTITAQNSAGKSVTSTAVVTVQPRVAATISASQQNIDRGKTATINWNAPGAVAVSVAGVGSVARSGSIQVSPEDTATYTLTASYADGSVQTASVTVLVQQPPYLLWVLIGILIIAAIIAAVVIATRRPRAQAAVPAPATALPTQEAHTVASDATQPTDVLPATTPIIQTVARLSLPDGSEILLAGNSRSLGRHDFEKYLPPADVSYISRQHLNLWYENDRYYVEDRSSTNGTRLNGLDIKGAGRRALANGDVLDLAGKLQINFKENHK